MTRSQENPVENKVSLVFSLTIPLFMRTCNPNANIIPYSTDWNQTQRNLKLSWKKYMYTARFFPAHMSKLDIIYSTDNWKIKVQVLTKEHDSGQSWSPWNIRHDQVSGTMWKVLSQGIHMCNMEALSLLVRKLWPRLKFLFTHTRAMTSASRLVKNGTMSLYPSSVLKNKNLV